MISEDTRISAKKLNEKETAAFSRVNSDNAIGMIFCGFLHESYCD